MDSVIYWGKKIPQLARSFGKTTTEFKNSSIEQKIGLEKIKNQDSLSHKKLETIADTLRIDYDGKYDESLKNDINTAIKKGKIVRSPIIFECIK